MKKNILLGLVIAIIAVAGFVFLSKQGAENVSGKPIYVSNLDVKVLSPNGGEKFTQGTTNTISWSGGNRIVAIGLVKPEATTDVDIASAGLVIGWINNSLGERFFPVGTSATWDGLKVCDLVINSNSTCRAVSPGNYKIVVLSEDKNGSIYIGSGSGATFKYTRRDLHGNWDLSDQQFTIVAQ